MRITWDRKPYPKMVITAETSDEIKFLGELADDFSDANLHSVTGGFKGKREFHVSVEDFS